MNECNIVKDLMPLYEEELLSEDSLEFIRRHAANCPQCRKALQHNDALPNIQSQNPVSEKKIIKKALRRDRLNTMFKTLGAVLVVLAVVACYTLQTMYSYGLLCNIEASYPSPDGTCVLELVDRDTFNPRSDGYMIRFRLDRGAGGINRYWTDWDTIEPHWAPNGTDLLLMTTDMEGYPEIYLVDTSEHHHSGGTFDIPDMSVNLIPVLAILCRDQADFPTDWNSIQFNFHSWQEDSEAVVFSYETDLGQSGEITYHFIEQSHPSPDGTATMQIMDRDTFITRKDGCLIRFKLDGETEEINNFRSDWDTIEPHWAPDGTHLLLMVTSTEGTPEIHLVDTSESPHLEVSNLYNLVAMLTSRCREQADFPTGWDNIRFTFHAWQEDCETVEFCYETDLGQIGMITYHYPTKTVTGAQ